MLVDHLTNRFTAKWWEATSIESDKVEAITQAAYLSPSKQGLYEFEIVALTESDFGKEFKQWLYWENTACLNKVRGAQGPGLRRFNGQVLAPMVMIWLGKRYGKDPNIYGETNWSRVRDDCIISSTMAMCQAEELGVQTGFCGSIGGIDIANRLGKQDKVAEIVVGFGYANADPYFQRRVYKDGVVVGFDLSNTDPTKRTAENRKNRPAKDTMINYL
jgi:hypothetical protein